MVGKTDQAQLKMDNRQAELRGHWMKKRSDAEEQPLKSEQTPGSGHRLT